MKIKCIKQDENDNLKLGRKYIVYGVIIDHIDTISYLLSELHVDPKYSGLMCCYNEYFEIINFDIPIKTWDMNTRKDGGVIYCYKEMVDDIDNFWDALVDGKSWAMNIDKQRKAQIDAELREINYEKMVGRLMNKLNFLKRKCEKFEFNISNIINLELETKEIKREINFIKDNKNSWLYINAKDNKFEASASSDNLLQILKFGCRWLEFNQ